MKVLISDRRDALSTSSSPPTPHRHPFTTVLREATVLFLAMPLTPSTRNLISTTELDLLCTNNTPRPRQPIIINVSRGGITDEAAILTSLRLARSGAGPGLFGYGTDVFAVEPAGDADDSVLLGAAKDGVEGAGLGREALNLVMTAHLAWLSGMTVANQVRRVGDNIRAWMEGEGEGDVVVLGTRR